MSFPGLDSVALAGFMTLEDEEKVCSAGLAGGEDKGARPSEGVCGAKGEEMEQSDDGSEVGWVEKVRMLEPTRKWLGLGVEKSPEAEIRLGFKLSHL